MSDPLEQATRLPNTPQEVAQVPNENPSPIWLRVLIYGEDDGFVALALEMDLRGYGTTPEEAREELAELVVTQISFALFKGEPEMMWKDAEHVWFSRWESDRRKKLAAHLRAELGEKVTRAYDAIRDMPFPDPQVISKAVSGFQSDGQTV